MEYYEGQHKDRSLKDCMLLVAQRLTKYPVLVEQVWLIFKINLSSDTYYFLLLGRLRVRWDFMPNGDFSPTQGLVR